MPRRENARHKLEKLELAEDNAALRSQVVDLVAENAELKARLRRLEGMLGDSVSEHVACGQDSFMLTPIDAVQGYTTALSQLHAAMPTLQLLNRQLSLLSLQALAPAPEQPVGNAPRTQIVEWAERPVVARRGETNLDHVIEGSETEEVVPGGLAARCVGVRVGTLPTELTV